MQPSIEIRPDILEKHRSLFGTKLVKSFFNFVQMLKLDVSQIAPIHGKPVPWTDFLKVIGTKE